MSPFLWKRVMSPFLSSLFYLHEIGHNFGSLGVDGWGTYVDREVAWPNHTGSGDDDIMSYNSIGDAEVEFSIESIQEIRRTQLV
jgi:hypothetical protein